MQRHDLDLTSLLSGLVFAVVAVWALLGQLLDGGVDPVWVVPGVLIGLGTAGLAGTWARLRGHGEPD